MTSDLEHDQEHGFHENAHPEAREITGDGIYGQWGQCVAENRHGERCRGDALGPHGKCYSHGGATPSKDENDDVGAPEGNANAAGNAGGDGAPVGNTRAVSHGLHADAHTFYTEIATDGERDVIDDVYQSYLKRFRDRHGEPDDSEQRELFLCAVTIGKEIHGESWAAEKPAAADAGNALLDREPTHAAAGDGTCSALYSLTAVQYAIQRLSTRRRQWLKDMGLLEPPVDHMSAEADDLASIIAERAAADGDRSR